MFNVECNAVVDMTLIRPSNKGQGRIKAMSTKGVYTI